jgi:hypothetical protein
MWTYYIIIITLQNRSAGDVNTLHWKTLSWLVVKDIIEKNIGKKATSEVTAEDEDEWLSSGDECLRSINNVKSTKSINNNNNNNKEEEDLEYLEFQNNDLVPTATEVGQPALEGPEEDSSVVSNDVNAPRQLTENTETSLQLDD